MIIFQSCSEALPIQYTLKRMIDKVQVISKHLRSNYRHADVTTPFSASEG